MTIAGFQQKYSRVSPRRKENDEFAILLSNGWVFYTGGWESIESLMNALTPAEGREPIAGSFDANDSEYNLTRIQHPHIISITDLRGEA